MHIALIAEKSAGIAALRAIASSAHRLVAVFTSIPPYADSSPSVWTEATKLGIRPRPAHEVKNSSIAEEIRNSMVDVILNVHSLYVLPRQVREAARLGAFNLHPGPLPRFAGLNVASWAIYRGETSFGVTLHKMSDDIDAGPIVDRLEFPIGPTDTGLTLNWRCWSEGKVLLDRFLELLSVSPDAVPLQEQDLSAREYFGRVVPQNGCIDWNLPAARVHNFVRASNFLPYRSPWGFPRTRLGDYEVGIVKTTRTGVACREKTGSAVLGMESVQVACADEWIAITAVETKGGIVRATEVFNHDTASSYAG
jgi:methionyl-tRNA formyltransferase